LTIGVTTGIARLGEKFGTATSANYGGIAMSTWSTTAAECTLIDIIRSKSATIGTQTLVANNDNVGQIIFRASDGVVLRDVAQILVAIDGTSASADMPGRMTFWTTPDAGVTMVERMRITNIGNVKIAGTVSRATTEGTNHLDIFDGTAPVGTLANGISLYSTAGELRVMDAGGTATLLSPHDKEGYWVYDSTDTTTGRRLKIDMEKFMKWLNKKFDTDFVHEYMKEQ
jgi:hypothetical protein